MIHARHDYQDDIVSLTGRIPVDEPVMLFRAQDKYAKEVLELYKRRMEEERDECYHLAQKTNNCSRRESLTHRGDAYDRIATAVAKQIKRFEDWPTKKEPDINPPSTSSNNAPAASEQMQMEEAEPHCSVCRDCGHVCDECGKPAYSTASGLVCASGHGGCASPCPHCEDTG